MGSSGASSNQEVKLTGCMVLCSVRAAKMQERCLDSDEVEIGRVEAMSRSIFEKFSSFYMRKSDFFTIRYLIINFNTLNNCNLNCLTGLYEPFEPARIRPWMVVKFWFNYHNFLLTLN